VGVVGRGQAGADVEELPDARLGHQVVHRAGEELALQAGDHHEVGEHAEQRLADLTIDGEVILSAQQEIPYPGRVRHRRVDASPGRLGGIAVAHVQDRSNPWDTDEI
jgi:hypothetical protein